MGSTGAPGQARGFVRWSAPGIWRGFLFPSGFSTVLLECLTNRLANEVIKDSIPDPTGKDPAELEHLLERAAHLVVVSGRRFPSRRWEGMEAYLFALEPSTGSWPPGGSGGRNRSTASPYTGNARKGRGGLSWWRFPSILGPASPQIPWKEHGVCHCGFPLGWAVGGRGPGFCGHAPPPHGSQHPLGCPQRWLPSWPVSHPGHPSGPAFVTFQMPLLPRQPGESWKL